jgi:ABC-type cobalamin transport system ATPase subunit
MGVFNALQLRSIYKRFSAGAGTCLASASVLRGVYLELNLGESLAIVGAPGAGKSALVLCAAGLLQPDSGERKWFGVTSLALVSHRLSYHYAPAGVSCVPPFGEPRLHLLDLHPPFEANPLIDRWIDDRCGRGDAVILTARDERFARRTASRVLLLSSGVLRPLRQTRARVAEPVRR